MFSRVLSLASRSTVSPAYVWCNAVTAQTYRSFFSTEAGQAEQKYENVIVEKKGNVGILTLNRPKTLHALCDALVKDVNNALTEFQNDDEIGCVVLTGAGKKSFAAGADISEMVKKDFMDAYKADMFAPWDNVSRFRKPIIAAVNGYALGGGCELAMMCDIIIASDNAQFAQPEIALGTIPGVGGTQRLTRAIGKSKAMELILTGRFMNAQEALDSNLVSKVVPQDQLLEVATEMASKIASFSKPVVAMAKECVNQAYESTLREGVHFERRVFHSTFAIKDRKEGMEAFLAKRPAAFKDV